MTLIGVKSKYGSGWGTSPGIMNINNTPKKKSVQGALSLSGSMVRIRRQAQNQYIVCTSYFEFFK